MAAFLTPPSLHWTRSVHDRVPRLCRAPALGSCSCPFSGRGAPVAAVGVRFLAPLSMPNGPVGAAFRWTPDRGQTIAAPTFTASTLTPAMGGDDGVHPVNAGRVSTSSTLNPQEVAACASSASFVQLVGAVGPTRSAGSDVVWASALASHPGTPAVVVDCKDAVRTAVRQLRKVVGKAARNRPIKQASMAPAHDVDEPKKYKDMRSGALALVATSGSGKTYMLEQIATEGASASLFNSDREPEVAKFCRQLQPFVLNLNRHWKLTTVEANLITDQDVVFNFDGLVHLRLIFMHYADLSASYLPYHFQRFVAAVSLALRTKRLCSTAQDAGGHVITSQVEASRAGGGSGGPGGDGGGPVGGGGLGGGGGGGGGGDGDAPPADGLLCQAGVLTPLRACVGSAHPNARATAAAVALAVLQIRGGRLRGHAPWGTLLAGRRRPCREGRTRRMWGAT